MRSVAAQSCDLPHTWVNILRSGKDTRRAGRPLFGLKAIRCQGPRGIAMAVQAVLEGLRLATMDALRMC